MSGIIPQRERKGYLAMEFGHPSKGAFGPTTCRIDGMAHDPTVFCPAGEVWYNLDAMGDGCFWSKLDQLVDANRLVVDRPAGTAHPRFPSLVYPLDYGYLEGTRSGDGDGVDVWIGSQPERTVTAIVCTVDLEQKVAEMKVLLGCTAWETNTILRTHNVGSQSAVLVERSEGHSPAGKKTGKIQEGSG